MTTELTAALKNLFDPRQQGESLFQKNTTATADVNLLRKQRDEASINLVTLEKKHILDQVTDRELADAQKLFDDLEAKLSAATRRLELIHEAIAENDLKINAAAQNLRIARYEFCFKESNKNLEKIKQNKEVRALIVKAMAACAANGHALYLVDAQKFVFDNFNRIVANISVDEIREAEEKFKKENGLD